MTEFRTPYEGLGEDGIRQLVAAFYDIMDASPEAADIRKMHADDLSPMKMRLGNYLIEWMGGPPVYTAMAGSMCMTEPHANFWIGPKERDQWLWCMDRAIEQVALPPQLRDMLKEPFSRIADAVRNQQGDNPAHRDPNIIAAG